MNTLNTITENSREDCAAEIGQGKRFGFGDNWRSFLRDLDDERIEHAQNGLADLVGKRDLSGVRFLDVGCGSGLSSLVARKLGAEVTSFDFDPSSVKASVWLRDRYFSNDPQWQVLQGSVLDSAFMASLGTFDLVYAWGSLHHTGHLWDALENSLRCVAPNGGIAVAIYNEQGGRSKAWRWIKRLYCSGFIGRLTVCTIFIPYFFLRFVFWGTIKRKNYFKEHKKIRGMSIFHDWLDWLGGYPFEVASVEKVFDHFTQRGFELKHIHTVNGQHGNNEFHFARSALRVGANLIE